MLSTLQLLRPDLPTSPSKRTRQISPPSILKSGIVQIVPFSEIYMHRWNPFVVWKHGGKGAAQLQTKLFVEHGIEEACTAASGVVATYFWRAMNVGEGGRISEELEESMVSICTEV